MPTLTPHLRNQDVLLFAPRYNTGAKRDATGAFQPGAKRFCAYHSIDWTSCLYLFDNSRAPLARAAEVLDVLKERRGRPVVGGFFHGWRTGCQLGFRSPDHPCFTPPFRRAWNELVLLLSEIPDVVCPWYACSMGRDEDGDEPEDSAWTAMGTGGGLDNDRGPNSVPLERQRYGDDSFGDLLRDDLCVHGAEHNRQFCHFSAGHTSHNGDIILFDGDGRPYGAVGGVTLWRTLAQRNTLRRLLRRDRPEHGEGWGLAWRAPFMRPGAICREILQAA